jgi:hypothetical protein
VGLEAITRAEWRGEVAEVKALLETHELILRGDFKLRLACADLSGAVDGDDLVLSHPDGRLVLGLGAAAAGRWLTKITTKPPSLADKLGLKRGVLASVTGDWQGDDALAAALSGHLGEPAGLHIAVVLSEGEFERAVVAVLRLGLPTWFVHEKGKAAAVTDGMIRQRLRGAGWIDTKSSGVSERLTTTRYQKRQV